MAEVPPDRQRTLIARGSGADAYFKILDGSERVADVHRTWAGGQEFGFGLGGGNHLGYFTLSQDR